MIIYNVTVSVDQTIEIQWLEWMKVKHIKEVLGTGCFLSAKLMRLTSHSQPDATSYAVQYLCESNEKLKQYYDDFSEKMRKDGSELWGDKMQAFRTELELIQDFYSTNN